MASRTQNSVINIAVSIFSYLFIFLLQLLNRTIFIKYLPIELLGVNGLFSNILSLLSLSELGISTAIAYSLYNPLKENNYEEINLIMKLYKKLYTIIGFIVLLLGLSFTSILNVFVKEIPDYITWFDFRLYFIIYVMSTSASFFGTYKRTLIVCDQKQYIANIVSSLTKTVLTVLQILSIIIWSNYTMYLSLMIFTTLLENLILTIIANNKYPYIKNMTTGKLDSSVILGIKKNIFAMVFHRVGDVVINATDNLIISRFSSLALAGLYSNYFIIVNAIKSLLNQIFGSITASVGNMIANKDKVKDKEVFDNILFINFVMYSYCTVCFFSLLNRFITLWIGERYLLSTWTVLMICYSFYFTGMMKTVRIFRDAAGVFYYDRFKPILESIINIVASIPLTIKYQVGGTLAGTVISCIVVSFWIEGLVLFKYHFELSARNYYFSQIKFLVVHSLLMLIVFLLDKYNSIEGVWGLVFQLFLTSVITIFVFYVLYQKSSEFKYMMQLIRKLVRLKNVK